MIALYSGRPSIPINLGFFIQDDARQVARQSTLIWQAVGHRYFAPMTLSFFAAGPVS
jgi:hypothetical protein